MLHHFLDPGLEPIQHLDQVLPAAARPATQIQPFQLFPDHLRPKLLPAADPFAQRQCLQLVLHRRAKPHQLHPVPQQLPRVPLGHRGNPDLIPIRNTRTQNQIRCMSSRLSGGVTSACDPPFGSTVALRELIFSMRSPMDLLWSNSSYALRTVFTCARGNGSERA